MSGKWDTEAGSFKVIGPDQPQVKPDSFLELDRNNWKNVISSVEDDDLREHMQRALDEGNEDLLNSLIEEATFKS